MSSPQGRTGTILGQTQSPDGKMWYVKQNPREELTDIEFRIYRAAREVLGIRVPEVLRCDNPTILMVEDAGTSLENMLHTSQELMQKREEFTQFLTQNIAVRSELNKIIQGTLTITDQQFLLEYNSERLLRSMKQWVSEDTIITMQDIHTHFWAYRVMNAIGVYDESFKEAYTQLIGSKIETLLPKYGSWLQDNCLRNNASPDGKIVMPFDFNSLQYGLRQMDETGMSGLYLFHGILGVFDSAEKRDGFIEERAIQCGYEGYEEEEYREGYILSVVHQQVLLAGYRTQEAKYLKRELQSQQQELGGIKRGTVIAFRSAFDEIDYHQASCVQAFRECSEVFISKPEERKLLGNIDAFITHYTFGQRVGMMF